MTSAFGGWESERYSSALLTPSDISLKPEPLNKPRARGQPGAWYNKQFLRSKKVTQCSNHLKWRAKYETMEALEPIVASTENKSSNPKMSAEAWLWWGPVALFALTLLPWEYGYFIFLRLVVTACSVVIAFKVWKNGEIWGPIFAAMALLFNPIIRVSFGFNTWLIIDLVAAVIFILHRRIYLKSLEG